jgi:CheY-like chemotaxis protein
MSAIATLRILIADDHEPMRAVLERALRRAGAENVRTAADGVDAMAQLLETPADLVLADHSMPGMTGLAFIAAVRTMPAMKHARLMMITGSTDPALADAARAEGADAVLVKPIAPSALLKAIEEILAR